MQYFHYPSFSVSVPQAIFSPLSLSPSLIHIYILIFSLPQLLPPNLSPSSSQCPSYSPLVFCNYLILYCFSYPSLSWIPSFVLFFSKAFWIWKSSWIIELILSRHLPRPRPQLLSSKVTLSERWEKNSTLKIITIWRRVQIFFLLIR